MAYHYFDGVWPFNGRQRRALKRERKREKRWIRRERRRQAWRTLVTVSRR